MDAYAIYERSSKQVSDGVRQLALAGVAIIWLFRTGEGAQTRIGRGLLLPLLFIVVALLCDLVQYIYSTNKWKDLIRKAEAHNGEVTVVPVEVNQVPLRLFQAKIAATGIAYLFLGWYFLAHLI